MTTPPDGATGATLRVLRQGSGLSQRKLARLAGVSPTYLCLVENGLREPSRQWVGHIAHVIGNHMKVPA